MLNFTSTVLTTDSSTMMTVISFALLIAVFYFMLIRPESKRKKAAAKMRSELAVGNKITSIGGVVGTIVSITEDNIVIETSADRVRMEFAKWAVSTNDTAAPAKK